MPPPTTDDFRAELRAQIRRAIRQRRPHVEINAGELHRKVGGYPPKSGENHAMSSCCGVMRAEFVHGKDAVIFETTSGRAPAYTIRYHLPR
jgi:5-methylcytosine-specific restriction protein A